MWAMRPSPSVVSSPSSTPSSTALSPTGEPGCLLQGQLTSALHTASMAHAQPGRMHNCLVESLHQCTVYPLMLRALQLYAQGMSHNCSDVYTPLRHEQGRHGEDLAPRLLQ